MQVCDKKKKLSLGSGASAFSSEVSANNLQSTLQILILRTISGLSSCIFFLICEINYTFGA